MKIIRSIVLEFLLLVVMLLCGTVTMKTLDILFKLNYEKIVVVGFKVGFIAWLVLLVITIILKNKKGKSQL